MKGSKTDDPFFCKLFENGLSKRNAINQHKINHEGNVLKKSMEAKELKKISGLETVYNHKR